MKYKQSLTTKNKLSSSHTISSLLDYLYEIPKEVTEGIYRPLMFMKDLHEV